MGPVLESLPREGRFAVIRLRSLRDCVRTTPALDILKRSRLDLRVAVIVAGHTAQHPVSAMCYLGAPIGKIPRAKVAALDALSAFRALARLKVAA